VRAIEKALVDGEGIQRIIHMKTMHLGPEELLVGAKVGVPHTATATDIAAAIDSAEWRVRAAVPIARVIYIEPDIYRLGAAEATTAVSEDAGT
jgi:divalent metal cation (Fe/Co/Zn/Cd) transporter